MKPLKTRGLGAQSPLHTKGREIKGLYLIYQCIIHHYLRQFQYLQDISCISIQSRESTLYLKNTDSNLNSQNIPDL